ncbi:MAG: hypothetical protein AAF597_10260, partial [Bacteroidota bacterium]
IGDAYIENTGGKDAWLAIQAMKIHGKASMQGMEFPITMTTAMGNKQHLEVDVQGQKIVQAYDGETAWQIMPFQGVTEPTPMDEDQAQQMKDTKFLSEFINTEARGFMLKSVEGKELEGTPTYGVQVTHADGYDVTYYFDQEYMIPIMSTSPIKSGPQKGAMMETYMSDYQEQGDVMMPMFMEVKFNGETIQKITLEGAELNPEIKDAMFSLPKKE